MGEDEKNTTEQRAHDLLEYVIGFAKTHKIKLENDCWDRDDDTTSKFMEFSMEIAGVFDE